MATPQAMPTGTDSNDEARSWALGAHLAAYAGLVIPLGTILGPMVIWLIKREEMKFVDDQGKEAMNFHICLTIVAFGLAILTFVGGIIPLLGLVILPIGILTLLGVALFGLIMPIIAAIKAKEGVHYRYPLVLFRLIQ